MKKRLNYFQVHKNKHPKRILIKRELICTMSINMTDVIEYLNKVSESLYKLKIHFKKTFDEQS